mmetsp:Transcript_10602/g.24931  ORF Transcript_10602/g.24931 Transcript_10602/m.24931 type:complete len:255 (+) Transcript_10602:1526-2290(+)
MQATGFRRCTTRLMATNGRATSSAGMLRHTVASWTRPSTSGVNLRMHLVMHAIATRLQNSGIGGMPSSRRSRPLSPRHSSEWQRMTWRKRSRPTGPALRQRRRCNVPLPTPRTTSVRTRRFCSQAMPMLLRWVGISSGCRARRQMQPALRSGTSTTMLAIGFPRSPMRATGLSGRSALWAGMLRPISTTLRTLSASGASLPTPHSALAIATLFQRSGGGAVRSALRSRRLCLGPSNRLLRMRLTRRSRPTRHAF